MIIPGKDAETLVTAVDTMWMQVHIPLKGIMMDGEVGVRMSHSSQQAFMEKGVKLHLRAKDTHAHTSNGEVNYADMQCRSHERLDGTRQRHTTR